MLTTKQIDPPIQFKPEGIGEPVIGVRILLPIHPITPYNYPAYNRVGTELLCRLLQVRMEQAGVHVTEPFGVLQFNWSFYLFTASQLEPALNAIKEELEKLGLLNWAQIGWHDPREEAFCVWWSKTGRFDVPSDGEMAAERNVLAALVDVAKEIKQSEDERPRE
jgi:hypothetical protein